MASNRGRTTPHRQREAEDDTAIRGERQMQWLREGLRTGRATWKVIASDMPIGLNVGDGRDNQNRARWEAVANGNNGPALGREMEIANLLSFIRLERIANTVGVTADVHYTAAHPHDPTRAPCPDTHPLS